MDEVFGLRLASLLKKPMLFLADAVRVWLQEMKYVEGVMVAIVRPGETKVIFVVTRAVAAVSLQSLVPSRTTPFHLALLNSSLSHPLWRLYTSTHNIIHQPKRLRVGVIPISHCGCVRQTLEQVSHSSFRLEISLTIPPCSNISDVDRWLSMKQ